MKNHCPTDEILENLMEGLLDESVSIAVEEHLLHCPGCMKRYREFSDRQPTIGLTAATAWGSAIACAIFGPDPLPRREVLALLEASSRAGWRVSGPGDSIVWIVADVSSGQLVGDEVDAARLAAFVRTLREMLPPAGRIGVYVRVGRGGIGRQWPFGSVFEQRADPEVRTIAARLQPGQLRVSGDVTERLQPLGVALQLLADADSPSPNQNGVSLGGKNALVPAYSEHPRQLDASGLSPSRSWSGLWGGFLELLPVNRVSASVVRSHRSHQAPSTSLAIADMGNEATDARTQAHRLTVGDSLLIRWDAPKGAYLHLLTRSRQGWQVRPNDHLEPAAVASNPGWIAVECPEEGEPIHVWLLATTGACLESEILLNTLSRLPAEAEKAVIELGEQLLTLYSKSGFVLLDLGTLERM